MKPGDLVTTQSGHFVGVILDSKTMVKISGLSNEQIRARGKDLNSHHVYWGDSRVERNPVWVKERDLVRAV